MKGKIFVFSRNVMTTSVINEAQNEDPVVRVSGVISFCYILCIVVSIHPSIQGGKDGRRAHRHFR